MQRRHGMRRLRDATCLWTFTAACSHVAVLPTYVVVVSIFFSDIEC